MNAKEQKIKEAYGEYWEELKQAIDENGWIEISWMQENEVNLDFDLKTNYENGIGQDFARPKRLQGIEDNNGWIKIESESDLPKQNGDYYVVYCGSINIYLNAEKEFFNWIGVYSHYRPILKPQPPIY